MDICIDFDGTCTTHDFPKVGSDIGAVPVLKALTDQGHRLILFTMRSNCENNDSFPVCVPQVHNGPFLDDAVNWFKQNNIPLFGIQSNPTQTWTTSPKAYGQLYIDDCALGAPLIHDKHDRPYICWQTVRQHLIDRKILKE